MDDDVTPSPRPPTETPTKLDTADFPVDQVTHHLGLDAMLFHLDDGPLVVVPDGPET